MLITGGAGFIGSHLSDALLHGGDTVRVLDSLVGQVHGDAVRPAYLDPDVELVVADVRDADTVRRALDGVDAVVHFAARVGVGQSMYEMRDYVDANSTGTAVLLEALLDHPVEKLLVASSMSVYGEGRYVDEQGRIVPAAERTRAQLERREWEPVGAAGEALTPVPTDEDKEPALTSVYALSKYDQERLCLIFGSAYKIPTVALRFFNVYGPRQALSNPYTGVLAIFASRLLNGNAPLIYEDGRQRRDFVSVFDVARAALLALERDGADGSVVNVGSGESASVSEIADHLRRVLGVDVMPEVTQKARVADVRHCFADIARARATLEFEPEVRFTDGIRELAEWLEGQVAVDRVDAASAELAERGLTT